MTFTATHLITLYAADGVTDTGHFLVMLDANEDGAGPAYTGTDWAADAKADWSREEDGSWLFQGHVVNCSVQAI